MKNIKKYRLFFIVLITIIAFTGCGKKIENKTDEAGIINLENWTAGEDSATVLNGDWDFYWNELLSPEDFNNPELKAEKRTITIPGVWNGMVIDGKKLNENGYATLRTRITNLKTAGEYGIKIPFHFSAYNLFLNGELKATNGKVGTTKKTMVAQTLPQSIYFDIKEGQTEVDLVLQISNFMMNKGGVPAPYKFGTKKQISKISNMAFFYDVFLAASLFIMGLYHIGLYLLRRKEKSPLYFGILCFMVILRTIGLGETMIIRAIPNFNFEIYIKTVFLPFFFGIPIFTKYVGSIFPQESKRKIENTFLILGAIFSVSLFFPARFSADIVLPFEGLCIFMLIYIFYVLIKAMFKRREGAVIAFGAIMLIVSTTVNDILFDNQLINTGYYAPFGVFGFIFAQSFLLSLKFSNAFKSIEQLSDNIIKINDANRRFVPQQFLSFLGHKSIVDIKLGDNVNKKMTVLFADIRSFTSISEEMESSDIFKFLNGLLKRISPIIRENNGFIDKYIGDAIMALFPENPDDAIKSAIAILNELQKFNTERLASGKPPVKIGIGIHTGDLILGTIGEEMRMEGTVISDTVNLASRLEGLSKKYNADIIVSEDVINSLSEENDIHYRFLGNVRVKGKDKTVTIYDVFNADSEEIFNKKHKVKDKFKEAVDHCQQQRYNEAHEILTSILKFYPDDTPSKFYLQKITPMLKDDTHERWDGVATMTTK
jgi:class 3 adenylate cyclase